MAPPGGNLREGFRKEVGEGQVFSAEYYRVQGEQIHDVGYLAAQCYGNLPQLA